MKHIKLLDLDPNYRDTMIFETNFRQSLGESFHQLDMSGSHEVAYAFHYQSVINHTRQFIFLELFERPGTSNCVVHGEVEIDPYMLAMSALFRINSNLCVQDQIPNEHVAKPKGCIGNKEFVHALTSGAQEPDQVEAYWMLGSSRESQES